MYVAITEPGNVRMLGNLIKRFYGSTSTQRLRIKEILSDKIPRKEASIQGWVRSVRKHKRCKFIDVNDGSTFTSLQVVVDHEHYRSEINYGASVCINGDVVKTKLHKDGIEMLCKNLTLIGDCNEEFVFYKHANHDPEYLRAFPHMRMKESPMASVLRTRNVVEMEIHRYYQEKGFFHIHTPVLSSSDCEGAGETFSITTNQTIDGINEDNDIELRNLSSPNLAEEQASVVSEIFPRKEPFFGKPVYLTVSGQLHLEACALGVGNVYTLGPIFRAEKSSSRKHLSEFRMLEVELAFTQSLDDLLNIMEDSIQSILKTVCSECWLEQNHFFKKLPHDHKEIVERAASKNFVRLSYKEALEMLQQNSNKLKTFTPAWGDDFNTDQENCLVEICGYSPVFISDFPIDTKPFYMYVNPDHETVAAVDLIFPFCGELCGGSVREHRLDVLTDKLTNLGMLKEYDWYLDLRKYGNIPHAGYGMGFDRLIRFILGINNIKDAVPFPRWPGSCLL